MAIPCAQTQGELIRATYPHISYVFQTATPGLHCHARLQHDNTLITFDALPFSSGGQRLAFHGDIHTTDNGQSSTQPVVVKFDLATPATKRLTTRQRTAAAAENIDRTLRSHAIAAALADRWQTRFRMNKAVHVLHVQPVTLVTAADVRKAGADDLARRARDLFARLHLTAVLFDGAVGTVEPFVEGRFTKFVNNDGSLPPATRSHFPPAFVHWSWVVSRRALMITDIQGVRSSGKYVLTDPCVHSTPRVRRAANHGAPFGANDLGSAGIHHFFDAHVCNPLCAKLALPGLAASSGLLPKVLLPRLRSSRETPASPTAAEPACRTTVLARRANHKRLSGSRLSHLLSDNSRDVSDALRSAWPDGAPLAASACALPSPLPAHTDAPARMQYLPDRTDTQDAPQAGRLRRFLQRFSRRASLKDVMQSDGCRRRAHLAPEADDTVSEADTLVSRRVDG